MKTIMIVDDSLGVRKAVKGGLETISDEYEVISVKNGNTCYELLKAGNIPDLILLDIMMPGMSGWMLFDRIKENPKWNRIPVIFLTARTDPFAKKAGHAVADDYIEKPFELEDLKERVDKAIKKGTS